MTDPRLIQFDRQGDRVVGVFCGLPLVVEVHREAERQVLCPRINCKRCLAGHMPEQQALYNFYSPNEGAMRIIEAAPCLLSDLVKVGRKYGLRDLVFEVERRDAPNEPGPRYSILPEGHVSDELQTALEQAPMHDLEHITWDVD